MSSDMQKSQRRATMTARMPRLTSDVERARSNNKTTFHMDTQYEMTDTAAVLQLGLRLDKGGSFLHAFDRFFNHGIDDLFGWEDIIDSTSDLAH